MPLYNTCHGPAALVNVLPIMDMIADTTSEIRSFPLSSDSPPVFLLDSDRMQGSPYATRFDNRWMIFPEDFPSGNFLASRGYSHVLIIQGRDGSPKDDLTHVVLRWQEAGLRVSVKNIYTQSKPSQIKVKRPLRYKSLWYRALALFGFQRNSAGGFGAVIPEPYQSSGRRSGWG